MQGDKVASGSCLYSQDLGNCLQSCLGQLDMKEQWILCPVIRIMFLSAPSFPYPASCGNPFCWLTHRSRISPSVRGKHCSNYHFVSSWSSVKELEARKDNGGDRNYVKNSCISLHLVQRGSQNVHKSPFDLKANNLSHSNSVLLDRKASGNISNKGLYRKINYIYWIELQVITLPPTLFFLNWPSMSCEFWWIMKSSMET